MSKSPITPTLQGYLWETRENCSPRLTSVTESVCPAGYVGYSKTAEWLFDYSFTPFGKYRVGTTATWRTRQAFEAHLYPPMTHVQENTAFNTVGGRTHSIFITFTGGEHAGLVPMTQPAGYARFIDAGRQIGPLLERMLQLGRELEQEGFWGVQGLLCEIFMLLHHSISLEAETYLVPELPTVSPHSDFVRRVRAFLHTRISEALTRDMIAEHLNISVSALSHRYRQETGEAPMTTLNKMRVALAKTLLLKGYRLKTIAAQTGFCDEYHLSKVFKQMEGLPARDFRKQRGIDIKNESSPL